MVNAPEGLNLGVLKNIGETGEKMYKKKGPKSRAHDTLY